MFKTLIAGIVFFSISVNADSNYLAKTVTTEGYVSEYSIITGSGENDSLFGTHFTLANTKEDAGVSANGRHSVNGSVFIQHCNRDEFSKAGYSIPSTESVQANVDILKKASADGEKVRITYWDNGHPLSGKCVIRLDK